MYCPNCQKPIPDESLVCGYCGKPISDIDSDDSSAAKQKIEQCKNKIKETASVVASSLKTDTEKVSSSKSNNKKNKKKQNSQKAGGANCNSLKTQPQKDNQITKNNTDDKPINKNTKKIDFNQENIKSTTKNDQQNSANINNKSNDNNSGPSNKTNYSSDNHKLDKQLKTKKELEKAICKNIEDEAIANAAALAYAKTKKTLIPKIHRNFKPLSTAGFFFTEFLLLIPIINILMLFIWALRSKTNANRKAFARSILIWLLIILITSFSTLIVLMSMKIPVDPFYWFEQFKYYINSISI